jgi:hypothetical protein
VTAPPVGVWDEAGFREYRAASGARRRFLASKLIVQNTPLLKVLADQIWTGKSASGKPTTATRFHEPIFKEIPWDDILNAARIAMAKALDQFDPSKSKISGYLAAKVRYEAQVLGAQVHLAHAPRGRGAERPDVSLIGAIETDDDGEAEGAMACGYLHAEGDAGGMVDVDFEPEEIAEWNAADTDLDFYAWRESRRPVVYSVPAPVVVVTAMSLTIDGLRFSRSARATAYDVWAMCAAFADIRGEAAPTRAELERAIVAAKGSLRVRRGTVRDEHDHPARGLMGVGLQRTSQPPTDVAFRHAADLPVNLA